MRVLVRDDATQREFALGAALGFGLLDPKRFIDLARAMGIPARDAARQVMSLITEDGRAREECFAATNAQTAALPQCEPPERYRNPFTTGRLR
jgi:hypothetical protein